MIYCDLVLNFYLLEKWTSMVIHFIARLRSNVQPGEKSGYGGLSEHDPKETLVASRMFENMYWLYRVMGLKQGLVDGQIKDKS